jgi:2-polyprenyl-6-methoxyphenol hydroxylase-like FAD-dependent oxidoreductase
MNPSGRGDHAIVLGGSMAGMLAARVLAARFSRVTIVERDRYPRGPHGRQGVPQGHHLHVLLVRGLAILKELFPGIGAELVAEGAIPIDTGADLKWLTPGGWGPQFRCGLEKLAFSRDLLDWVVFRFLAAEPNVRFREGCEVGGLTADSGRVTGITLRDGKREEEMGAGLIVDATGRGSRLPAWMKELGFAPPEETVVNGFLGYSSRIYERAAGDDRGWKAAFIQATPPRSNRAGVLFPIEGNRWCCTLGGGNKEYPPHDEAGFLEFARSLRSGLVYDVISTARPLSPIHAYRATENRLRHFHGLEQPPEGLVAFGDSVCAFNPVYGQGITVAALSALALEECLERGARGLPRRFYRKLSQVVEGPWMLATSEDCRYTLAEGGRLTPGTRAMQKYVDRAVSLSCEDLRLRRLWLEVFHMLKPPTALLRPAIVARVLLRRPKRPGLILRWPDIPPLRRSSCVRGTRPDRGWSRREPLARWPSRRRSRPGRTGAQPRPAPPAGSRPRRTVPRPGCDHRGGRTRWQSTPGSAR